MKKYLATVFCLLPLLALADSSCSATNEIGAYCSISCSTGEAAYCKNGLGASSPTCECEANSEEFSKVRKLLKSIGNKSLTAAPEQLEVIDVLSAVNAKLAALPPVRQGESCAQVAVSRQCHEVGAGCYAIPPGRIVQPMRGSSCNTVCNTTYETRCTPVIAKFSATPPFYSPKPIVATIVEPNWQSIPSSVMGLREEYINCGSLKQSISFRHQETTRVGYRITKTKSIRTQNAVSLNISTKVGFSFGEASSGMSASMSRDVTITDGNEESEETTRTLDETIPLDIAPMKRVVFDHFWIKREAPIRYMGVVTVDGPLAANGAGRHLLSEVLPSAEDRTFPFEGLVAVSSLTNGQSRYLEIPLTPEICSGKPTFTTLSSPY